MLTGFSWLPSQHGPFSSGIADVFSLQLRFMTKLYVLLLEDRSHAITTYEPRFSRVVHVMEFYTNYLESQFFLQNI